MAKCANCNEDALYAYEYAEGQNTLYCAADLPRFLYPRVALGTLPSADNIPAPQETSTDADVANETKKDRKKSQPAKVVEKTEVGEEVTNAVGEEDAVASNSDTTDESEVA